VSRRLRIVAALAAGLVLFTGLAAGPAAAADWPTRPITILVAFNAGGSVDRMARGLAPYLSAELGKPVTVVNRPGAGGQAGTTWFLAQPHDGHTLMVSPATPYLATNILITGAKYTLDDFAFVNAQWIDYAFLAVPKDRPYRSLKDLVDAIRANPGKVSTGVTFGSAGHVSTLVLLEALGLPHDAVRIVTFDGGGPLRTALAGGHVDFSIQQAEGAETIKDFVRPLAVLLDERTPDWDAPTINEALEPYGVTVPVVSGSVRALVAPAGFKAKDPKGFQRLVDAYKKVLANPEFQAWLKTNGMDGVWLGPERTTEIIKANFEVLRKYQHLLKD
ncbi:MAG TPA: tripartite tricarboxylate transporter substrate binding protein, partial [Thermodesulfobacteriota bacterium]